MKQESGRPNYGAESALSSPQEACGELQEHRVSPLNRSQNATTGGIGGAPAEQNGFTRFSSDAAAFADGGARSCVPATSAEEGAACGSPPCVFQVHAAPAIDPLIGQLFVCPQTLEALCLHRMLGLPCSFTWEHVPSPSLPWGGEPVSTQSLWPLASAGPALPAAVDPRTGMMMSGCLLLKALRSCARAQLCVPESHGAACFAEAPVRVHGELLATKAALENGGHVQENTPCSGSCETRSYAAVEQATEIAATELLQQAIGTALRFYIWKDEATFRGFTRPMFQNTFGYVYGSYYCWALRRNIRGDADTGSSPRVFPEDLRRHFPNFEDGGAAHDSVTVEELLVVDGVRRALRVVEQLLQGKSFLGGPTTNALDATVFAHLAILFSLPLPDRRELQRVLLNASSLLQYCRRVQDAHQIWPAGPSFLFGVSSLSETARGAPLRVHSWRQQQVSSHHGDDEEEMERSSEGQVRRFLWWLGSAACCAAILVAAGKTPFRLTQTRLPRSHRTAHEANNY